MASCLPRCGRATRLAYMDSGVPENVPPPERRDSGKQARIPAIVGRLRDRFELLLGEQVSTPPITPLLLFANAQVGAILLHRRWLPISFKAVRTVPNMKFVLDLFLELLVGGLVVGGVLALVFGGFTSCVVRRRRAKLSSKPVT